jgi:hypothetical protein
MDKDLARAMVLERCACYDRALESATKVLEKYGTDSDEAFWARRIIKSLGEEFLKQRFADKAMECYRLIVQYASPDDACRETGEEIPFDALGPLSIEVRTWVSPDVRKLLGELTQVDCNTHKSESDLIREGIYLVILKYATDKNFREAVFEKVNRAMTE